MGMPNGAPVGSIISEMEQIISQLERGTVVTKFFPKKRPERKTLMIRRETRQILWARTSNVKTFEGAGNNLIFKLLFFNKIMRKFL